MKSWVFATMMLVLVVPTIGMSATYYIDFASGYDSSAGTSKDTPWKRAPGMKGYAHVGYIHAAGDQFIFKGGVTWDNTIAPWNITNSGAPGNYDYYGVDKTWYLGAAWSRPVFDGGSLSTVTNNPYFYITSSYITFDNLQVQNIGVSGTNQGNYGIEFWNGHDITVQNMRLAEMARAALLFEAETGTTLSNITLVGNDISDCSWGIGIGAASANTIYDNVIIRGNVFHDFHSQIANAVHADGVMLFSAGTSNQYVGNVQFYDNEMYGDWSQIDTSAAGVSALFLCSSCGNAVTIYNNYGTVSATTGGYVILLSEQYNPQGPITVYNNSFSMNSNWYGFIRGAYVSSLTVKNNIYTGGTTVYYFGDATTTQGLVSDYNDFYGWSTPNILGDLIGGAGLINYSTLRSLGYEANGLNINPLFVSPTNLRLSGCSPAIGQGTNLSTSFSIDADGNQRPASTVWDMGAFKAGGKPCTPSSPTLRLTGVH